MKTIAFSVMLIALSIFYLNGQSLSKPEYESKWDVFLDDMDSAHPRSIVMDMGLAEILPVEGYKWAATLSIILQQANPDGLPNGDEYNKLVIVEDMISEFSSGMGLYSYRVANGGKWDFVCYLEDTTKFRRNCMQIMATLPEYKYTVNIGIDSRWTLYQHHYPDLYHVEAMGNAAVIWQLKERGDKLLVARDVNHYSYFPTAKNRSLMEKEVMKLGFVIEGKKQEDGPLPYLLIYSRDDKVDQESIDKLTYILLDLTLKYGGDYDGWECLVVTD
ncbi:hypothetical protein BH09BAC1_BH09BAC1_12720 [soil metagenome]